MIDYREATAAVAVVLDDAERSLIGDPRQGVYKVSLISSNMREAMQFAKHLARLGIIPTTTINHDELGQPILAHVNIYTQPDQATLFKIVSVKLAPARRQQLDDLVLARGPIPDEVLERIASAFTRGMSHSQIAGKLNEAAIIAGMGGKRWTARKVKEALAEHVRRSEKEAAAQAA